MRVRNCWLMNSLAALSIGLLSANVYAQAPVEVDDLQGAKVAWQKRHDLVRSFRATLAEDMITHVGYYEMVSGMVKRKGKNALPDKDVSVSNPTIVTIGENNFKYSYTRQRWSFEAGRLESYDYTGISNPEVRSHSFASTEREKRPSATRTNSYPTTDETDLVLLPIMLTIRSGMPFHRQLADYTPTGETVAVEGRNCVELLKGSQKELEYLYLDRQRDWVVRRIDVYGAGKLTMRLTVDYVAGSKVAWLPSRWSYFVRSPNGTPLVSGKAMISHYEINTDIPYEEFIPKYAPGTFVVDDTKGIGKETVSITRQDGSEGVGLPLSQRPTDEQLLLANDPPPRRNRGYLFLGGSVFVLGLVGLLWHRHRRRRAHYSTAACPSDGTTGIP